MKVGGSEPNTTATNQTSKRKKTKVVATILEEPPVFKVTQAIDSEIITYQGPYSPFTIKYERTIEE